MLSHISLFSKKKITLILLFFLLSLLLGACSGNDSDDEIIGWDYFETFNPIGTEYGDIANQYDSLVEDGVYDGGVALQVDSGDLYFAFPRQSMDAISDTDKCTAVYGTLETVFGITSDYNFDDFKELLNVTFEEYEGTQIGTASIKSGTYYVQIYTDNVDNSLTPDQGVAIFHNEDNRQGVSDVPDIDVYIDLHPVDSTAISSIGYDEEYSILAIEFRESQELWYYYGVPKDVYEALENADSIGGYYNDYIKGTYKSIEQN